MEITQDKIELIKDIIQKDRKYFGNEDMFDDFFNETCQRSLSVINVLESDPALESYIKRIASTSILTVLKNSGRLRRTKDGYKPTREVSLEDKQEKIDYGKIKINYSAISIPISPEDTAIQRDILEFIARSVKTISVEEPAKMYFKIYKMRYDQGLTQKEISEHLGISQSEVSKRLYKLMIKVKNIIE